MSSFTDPLVIDKLTGVTRNGKQVYVVKRQLVYYVGYKGSCLKLVVEPGTLTDLASTPFTGEPGKWMKRFLKVPLLGSLLKWYRREFAPDGPYRASAVLHDVLYYAGVKGYRGVADRILRESMKVVDDIEGVGVRKWKRRVIYLAVRLGGWRGYGKGETEG